MSETVLIVVTSQAVLPGGREGGFDWISVAVPYWRLREAGVRVAFASPVGGKPPGDPATAQDPGAAPDAAAAEDRHDAVAMFLGDAEAVRALSETLPLDAVDAAAWHGVLVADGLSGLWDLGAEAALDALLAGVWARGGVIGAIGTGTAALARLRDAEGRAVVAGRAIAAPADATLRARLGADAPDAPDGPDAPDAIVLPEGALRAAGARVVTGDADGDAEGLEAVEDGRLVTAADARAGAHLALELRGALAIHAPAMDRAAAAADEGEGAEGPDGA